MRTMSLILLGTMLLPLSVPVAANELRFASGDRQVGVLELYTSQGCSSCPPADKWLSSLKSDPTLWQDFVPLAFHVDYWDYIGWKDRFAHAAFTKRQRRYAREARMRTIYTPGFFYNGAEWRGWFVRRYFDFPDPALVGPLTAQLNDDHLDVEFTPSTAHADDIEVSVAVLGFGFETPVDAGENHGRELSHDFVVLGVSKRILDRDGTRFSGELRLPTLSQHAPRTGIAIWVNRLGHQRPLQATGGWLPVANQN